MAIIYHGTPNDLPAGALVPRMSFVEAIWASGDPSIGAIYAGPTGFVHKLEIAQGARMLAAFGDGRSHPWTYPQADDWDRILEWLKGRGFDPLDTFDCLEAFKIENGFQPPLGPAGQPSWEGLLGDMCELAGDAEDLLRWLGYDVVAHTERVELALGDRGRLITDARDGSSYAKLAARLRLQVTTPTVAVGVLDTRFLIPRGVVHVSRFDLASAEQVFPDDLRGFSCAPCISETIGASL